MKETIEKWNKSVLAGKDEEWGRYLQKNKKPLGPGPWYALRLTPKIHHCMGGLNINTNAQALDVMTDKPIPGLYAAGEVTGGVHGAQWPPLSSYAFARLKTSSSISSLFTEVPSCFIFLLCPGFQQCPALPGGLPGFPSL
ncbi:MAG TPA: hypothetical protein DDY86_00730, partial [Syntrophaceae bacterium]|nr:hypothetical protein [Syntrophaceae bacterium]